MNETRERLAAYAHDAWSGWMSYLFKKGVKNADGSFTIAADSVARWSRQVVTPYADLPEEEKASDRKEADQMLAIMDPMGVISDLQEKAIAVNAHAARMERENAFLREWLRGELTLVDAEIDAALVQAAPDAAEG